MAITLCYQSCNEIWLYYATKSLKLLAEVNNYMWADIGQSSLAKVPDLLPSSAPLMDLGKVLITLFIFQLRSAASNIYVLYGV